MEGAGNPLFEHIIQFAHNLDKEPIGFFGIVFLVLAGVALISNLESALNKIWGVTSNRAFYKAYIDLSNFISVAAFFNYIFNFD